MPISLFNEDAGVLPDAETRLETQHDPQHDTRLEPLPWEAPDAGPVRPGLGERARRGALLVGSAAAAAAGLAAYPWAALAVLLALVWLLRTGSLVASGVGDRRRLRGAKWYDGPRLVLGAPWDLVRTLPSTALLGLWAFGLAVAAMLLCYAVAAPLAVTLPIAGLVLVGSLWCGPGASLLRSPVGRVVRPLSRGVRGWLITICLIAALVGLLGGLAARGADWLPAGGPPFSGLAG